jgi:hypothetical protein
MANSESGLGEQFSLLHTPQPYRQQGPGDPIGIPLASPFLSPPRSDAPQSTNNRSFEKLKRGESGYGGAFCGVGMPGEGLLARKLRGLPLEDEDKGP